MKFFHLIAVAAIIIAATGVVASSVTPAPVAGTSEQAVPVMYVATVDVVDRALTTFSPGF